MSFNNHDKDDPNGKRYSKSQQVKDSSSVQLPSDTDLAAMAKFKSNEEVIAIINNAQSIQWLQHPAPDEYWYPNSSIVTFKQQGYIAGYRDATHHSLSDKEEKWISVEERLPENKQRVICCRPSGTFINSFEYDARMNLFLSYDHPFGAREITFWQPLPSPPKP